MGEFKEWLGNTVGTENVDSKIDSLYDKAKYAIKLVQLYDKMTNKTLLKNISTIADLNRAGTYGLYNSAENKKVIGPGVANKIRFKFGQDQIQQNNLQKLPNSVIKQYIPDIDERQLVPSDVIHVDVHNILARLGDSKDAVVEIASTIVHEATHELEFQTTGKTSEAGPEAAEREFKNWVQKNWNTITARIPQVNF